MMAQCIGANSLRSHTHQAFNAADRAVVTGSKTPQQALNDMQVQMENLFKDTFGK